MQIFQNSIGLQLANNQGGMDPSFYDVVESNHVRTLNFPIRFPKKVLQITLTSLQKAASFYSIHQTLIHDDLSQSSFKVYLREFEGTQQSHKISFIAIGI